MRNRDKLKVAVFNDTRRDQHYGCEFVMQTIVSQLAKRDIDPVFFWPVGKDWRNETSVFRDLNKIDAIIVNGEGSIHHSKERERAHYLTEIAKYFSKNHNIPSFLINTTLDEIGADIIENLRFFKNIWVRESSSMKILEDKNIPAQVVPDLTFMADMPPIQGRPFSVLATDSTIKFKTKYLKKLSSKKGWNYSELKHSSRPIPQDNIRGREVLRRYAKWLCAIILMKNRKNRYEFLQYLSSHKLVCTGRFHAVTLSLATKTPYLAVESNTPKISSLTMDVFGTQSRIVSLTDLDSISDPISFAWSETESDALTRFLISSRDRISLMFDELKVMIDYYK